MTYHGRFKGPFLDSSWPQCRSEIDVQLGGGIRYVRCQGWQSHETEGLTESERWHEGSDGMFCVYMWPEAVALMPRRLPPMSDGYTSIEFQNVRLALLACTDADRAYLRRWILKWVDSYGRIDPGAEKLNEKGC